MKRIFAFLCLALSLMGATHGDSPAKGRTGTVLVLASAATKVFTGLSGRNSFAIFNNGPNTIWCGFSTAITTATGFPVFAGVSLTIDLVYHGSDDQDFYCIASTADQVSPADTRWIQVR